MSAQDYRDELAYLNEFRRMVADEHADLAPFLAHRGNDPDVERLFEGFAFLTSRIRRRIDDNFPELTQGLLAYWWPQVLQPVPSCTVMNFSPLPGTPITALPKGTEVQSIPVDGAPCTFRTTEELSVVPFKPENVRLIDRTGGATLEVGFNQTAPILIGDPLTHLRLFVYGDGTPQVAQTLTLWMMRHLVGIEVDLLQEGTPVLQRELPNSAFKPAGFEGPPVIPDADNTHIGYRVLQEYFCFPERFQFFDLFGLDKIFAEVGDVATDSLIVRLHFNRRFDTLLRLAPTTISPNCVAAQNLFACAARPINVGHTQTDYLVEPENRIAGSTELFNVESVRALFPGSSETAEYLKFESMERNKEAKYYGYFRTRLEPREIDGKVLTYLSLKPFTREPAAEEVLSIDLRATNGPLPEALNPGDIHRHTSTSPGFADFKNITKPTRYIPQPTDANYLWRMTSNLSLNYRTTLEIEALTGIVKAYDALARVDAVAERKTREIMNGMRIEATRPVQRLFRGSPVRGIQTHLSVYSRNFLSEGDMYIFLSALERFFELLASINSFHELKVTDRDRNEEYRWQPRIGARSLL
ncbi:MAG: type VI secretion system baseplate subunit TssF [Planctomycetota bacterium]